MMERLGMEWRQIKHVFMNVPTRHISDQVISDMKRDKTCRISSSTASSRAADTLAHAQSSRGWMVSQRGYSGEG